LLIVYQCTLVGGSEWLATNRKAAEQAMVEGSGSCAPAARRYRLRCVAAILPTLMEREAAKEQGQADDDEEEEKEEDGATAAEGSFTVLLGELIVATKVGWCRLNR
jgi:ribosomal RNA-processing protein 12